MMNITHAAIAAAAVPLVLTSSSPMVVGLAIVGSQLPDLDTSTSIIGQVFYPISSQLEKHYPHRTVTHSFVAIAFVAVLWTILCYGLARFEIWQFSRTESMALWLGMFFSIVSDTFTVKGVQLFWPVPVWCYSGSSWDKKRIRTGSAAEITVMAVAMAIACWIWFGGVFSGGGSLITTVGQSIGVRPAVIKTYQENAARYQMIATIKGNFAHNSEPADGDYTVIANEGSEFVIADGDRIYKTGQNIITTSLKISTGDRQNTTVSTISFNDEPFVIPGNTGFVSGTITVDFPEDIEVESVPGELETVKVSGSTVTLNYCPVAIANSVLVDQYAIGQVTMRIFE